MRLLVQCLVAVGLSIAAVLVLDLEAYATIAVAAMVIIAIITSLRTYHEGAPILVWLAYVLVFSIFFGLTWAALPVWFLDGDPRLIASTRRETHIASDVQKRSDEEPP